jgi:F-type H+-transporting ATPase subunit b
MELFNPESGLIIWMLLVFGAVVFILGKFAWRPIVNAINKREEYIANAIKVADEANEKLARIDDEKTAILTQAREEYNAILKDVQVLKEKLIAEAKEQAQAEAEKMIEGARQTIIKEKEQALKDVRNQVAKLSVDIAGRVLRKNLESESAQKDLVDKILNEVATFN